MKKNLISKGLKFASILAVFAATGCAEYTRRILVCTPDQGSEFNKGLAKEYEILGNTEQNIMYDNWSANYYFEKAMLAKEGKCVCPTPLSRWNIQSDDLPELEAARARLMRALDLGAREVAPESAAYAQSHFDCWVEQQEEGWQKDDIASCRSEFYKSMADVELILMGGILQIIPANMVFFDFDKFTLDAESNKVIDAVADVSMPSMQHHHHILLIGRTDKIGDNKYNKNLSFYRAMAVKKALIRKGVPPYLITVRAEGETPGPKVDAHNRRVDIIFLEH